MEHNSQPDINIGTCGHVAQGKSTLIKSITGISPMRYKSEKLKNLTIKLGYANSIISFAGLPNVL